MPLVTPGGFGQIIKPPKAGPVVPPIDPPPVVGTYAFNNGIMFGNQAINGIQPITEANFISLKAKGFDSIRLGLAPSLVFTDKTCTVWKTDVKGYIDGIYQLCKKYFFTLIIDNHPLVYNVDSNASTKTTNTNNDNVNAAQLPIAKQIMRMFYTAWPNDVNVYLECLNEPDTLLFPTAAAWKNYHEPLVQDTRANDPLGNDRWILYDGQYQAYPSGFNNLTPIKLANGQIDLKCIPSVHVYDPYTETHDGVPFIATYKDMSGVRYLPGSPDNIGTDPAYIDNQFIITGNSSQTTAERTVVYNKAKIEEIILNAVNWCAQYGLKLHIGEFGVWQVQQAAYPLDTLAWQADIIRICRKYNIAFTMFAFQSNFPVTDDAQNLVKQITSYTSLVPALVNTFDVSTLPSMIEWLSTRNPASLKHNTAIATANQTVSQWYSLKGAYSYSMDDSDTNRPLLKTNVQNGQSVVRLTPSTMLRGNSAVLNASKNLLGQTWFIAGGWLDFNAGKDINLFFQEFINSYNNQRTQFFASKSSTNQAFAYVAARGQDGQSGTQQQLASVEYITTGFAIWSLTFNFQNATCSLRRNGVYVIPDGTPIPGMVAGATSNTAVLETDIGQSAATNSEGSNFDLSEFIRCGAVLPLATIQQAETQLAALYGVDFGYNPVLSNPAAFTLTFEDTFDGSVIDSTKWIRKFEDGRDTTPSNNELQVYTTQNGTVSGGVLDIKVKKENTTAYTGGTLPYSSAMLCSYSKFTQKYGYFEARVKTPSGKGLWPAFWLLNQNPYREIDIFEQFGVNDRIYGTVYYKKADGTYPATNGYFRNGINITADFHKFAVDWTPSYVRFFFDDYMFFQTTDLNFVPDIPLYMILNLAIDGNNPPDANTAFPADYLVDYVRVWQRI